MMNIVFASIIAIVISYLLGSVLPAYLLGRFMHRDITQDKKHKNPGTRNAFRQLGFVPGIISGIYDFIKAPLSVMIAGAFGLSPYFCLICGLVAVLGHIFPFYLKFNGGQGIASSIGLVIYCIVFLVMKNFNFLYIIIFVLILAAILLIVLKKNRLYKMGFIVVPVLIILTFIFNGFNEYSIFILILFALDGIIMWVDYSGLRKR